MPITAIEAGTLLAKYLKRAQMQQKELANILGIEPSYISRMVKGHINWTTGQYFGLIASNLSLSNIEIKSLNPAAVVEIKKDVEVKENDQNEIQTVPSELLKAAEIYKNVDANIGNYEIQIILSRLGNFRGGPRTSNEWIKFFNDISFWLNRE